MKVSLKNNKLNQVLSIFLISIAFLLSLFSPVSAQATKSVTLYYSDECSYCQQVNEVINQYGIESKVTIVRKNIKEDTAKLEYENVVNQCKTDSVTPILVSDNQCFVGYTLVTEELFKQAGLTENIPKDNVISSEENSGTSSTPKDTTNETTKTDTNSNENTSTQQTPSRAKSIELPWYQILIIIIAPAVLIIIAYLMITRLKM